MITFLSLGSNIGNKLENIETAINKINIDAGKVVAISKLYKTSAWGFKSENYFLNNVVKIDTKFHPQDLLAKLQKIETDMGRVRLSNNYSDRTIDIDILLYENIVIDEKELQIPHPLLQNRNFVIYPLCDIAPNFIHPVLKLTNLELLNKCEDKSCCELFFNE